MMNQLKHWRTKYTPIKPTYLDDEDRVFAGDVFRVQYLGYRKISVNAESTVSEILSRYSVKRHHMVSNQELIIDSMSTALHQDSPDQPLILFNIPLSYVKKVIHIKRDKHGHYCVLIVRDDDECCEGVQVMSCDSRDETASIIQSFQVAFDIKNKHYIHILK